MRSCLTALVLLAFLSPSARAADAAAGKPYEYQVLLKFGANRLLTPTYCRRLADELRDGLQSAFGPLAHVQVIDINTDAGAKANWIDPATVDWPDRLGAGKRHFVAIDYLADGQYSIRVRQYDGATGQASPLLRHATTADGRFVGRQILRFLNEDFGAVGTVSRKEDPKVWLQLQGGAIPSAEMARWVAKGSVFALVEDRGDGGSAQPIPATYLRTTDLPANGQVECELFTRYENPLRFWPQNTYRAIRLGTTTSRLRVRVTDPHGEGQGNLEVRVHAPDSAPKEERGMLRDSRFETRATYQGLAIVRIGGGTTVTVPVPILDDRLVEISVKSSPEEEVRDTVLADVRRETRALHDIILRLHAQRRQLAKALGQRSNREALEQVQTWLERLEDEQKLHAAEVARLKTETRKVNADVGAALTDCDKALGILRGSHKSLLDLEKSLKADRERAESPDIQEKRDAVAVLMQRVKLHKDAAEYDEAIEAYDQILNQTGEREDIRKQQDELKEAWKLKGPEHAEARRFAYNVWPKIASYEDLKAKLPEARQKFEVCKRVGDRLTTHKLHIEATGVALKILLEEAENIKKVEGEEASLFLNQLQKVKQELETLIKDMQAFIDVGGGDK